MVQENYFLMLTDDCNLDCSFCFKKHFKRNKYLTIQKGLDSVRWIVKRTENPCISLWGGEPFLNFPVMKAIIEQFPQLRYFSNTNGISINQEIYEWLNKYRGQYCITLSAGGHDVYNIPKLALRFIKENNYGINFTVAKPETLYDDFCWLLNYSKRILIEPPKGVDWSEDQIKAFETNLTRILKEYKNPFGKAATTLMNNVFYAKYDVAKIIPDAARYCGSGVTKLVIDTDCDIWQCDGFYTNQQNKLGSIYTGIDESKLDYVREYSANPKLTKQWCEGCDIYDVCPRAKCMAQNFTDTGDILKPSKTWCDINRMWIRITKEWID